MHYIQKKLPNYLYICLLVENYEKQTSKRFTLSLLYRNVGKIRLLFDFRNLRVVYD